MSASKKDGPFDGVEKREDVSNLGSPPVDIAGEGGVLLYVGSKNLNPGEPSALKLAKDGHVCQHYVQRAVAKKAC